MHRVTRSPATTLRAATAGMLLTALAACGAGEVPTGGLYRDGAQRITSAALFDPARFVDVWHVVGAYGAEAGCGPLSETWQPQASGGFRVTGTGCGPNGARAFTGEARITGPGRIARQGLNGAEELWVLWVDADYRMAVIGTPDGSFGRVLSRLPVPRPDLLNAAREVLAFNGYDPDALRVTARN